MTDEVYPDPNTLTAGELVQELIETNNFMDQQYSNRDTADNDEIQQYHRLQEELKERLTDPEWGLDLEGDEDGQIENLTFEDLQTGNELVLTKDGRSKGDLKAVLVTPNQRQRVKDLYEDRDFEQDLFNLGEFMERYPDDLPARTGEDDYMYQ